MRCIYCSSTDNKVVDSRSNESGSSIRRRRECLKCSKRFTSYESVELIPLLVIKKDGTRESFNGQKIRNGLIKACEKRPVSIDQINKLIDNVEKSLTSNLDQEVPSTRIGDLVMDELRRLDEIAYVRYAAVYREFKDIPAFLDFVKKMQKETR